MSEWTDIGEQLRKARESKGLDIRDVAHATRIPLSTLNALEESNYSIFPSPTYARSFLAQYSDYLQVDAHEWVEAFETGDVLSNVNDHEYLKTHNEHVGAHESESMRAHRSRARQSPSRKEEKNSGGGSSLLQTGTVFLVTALLIGGGIYAYQKFEPMFTGVSTSDTSENKSSADEPKEEESVVVTNDPEKQPTKPDTTVTTSDPPLIAVPVAPAEPETPALPKSRNGPPPKATVIEEDEE